MQRKALLTLAIALAMGCASTAFAQDDDLSGVTLRVLDDVSDIDAVVLSIDRERDGAEGADGEHRDGDRADGDGRDGDARDGADREGDERGDGDRDDAARDREDRDDHDELEDDDHLERGEGGLEDHDVERDRVTEHPDEPAEPVEP